MLDEKKNLKDDAKKKLPLLNAKVLAHRAGDVSLFGKQGRQGKTIPALAAKWGAESSRQMSCSNSICSIDLPGGHKNGGNIAKRLRRGCKRDEQRERKRRRYLNVCCRCFV